MKLLHLFIFWIGVFTCFSLLLFGALYDNSAWATVGITGILVIITAYYALSTDKILAVNQKQLELLILQKRSPKIEEIVRIVFMPLDDRIKEIKNRIQNKSNMYIIDPAQKPVFIHSLNNDNRFLTELDYINSQLESIKVNINYEDPIFQKYIRSILRYIAEYDVEQKNYETLLNSNIPSLFQKIIFPFIQKNDDEIIKFGALGYDLLFRSLIKEKLDSYSEEEVAKLNPSHFYFKKYSKFVDDCYQNNTELQKFIEIKSEHEKNLIKKLDALSTEVNLLLSDWMNVYHLITQSD
jgi:hypothetical protein